MPFTRRRFVLQTAAVLPLAAWGAESDWPSFRGAGACGVADNHPVRASWNADSSAGPITGVRWRVPVPGLGHSSPIVWRDRIYLPSAIRKSGKAPLKVGPTGGEPTAADDNEEQSWVVLCYASQSGSPLWQKVAHRAAPRATRHEKATHANTTMATEGQHLVAFFGSEGLYCYDLEGRLLWSRDLGVINISKYAIIWDSAQGGSYIATPVVYGDYIYFGNPNGVVRCFASKTGKKIYEERLSPDASVYASLVAADGKIFCASEDGDVYVLKAGPEFQIISRNRLGGPCYATPAISEGVLYFRTTDSLIAAGA